MDRVIERLRRQYGLAPSGVLEGLEADWRSLVGDEVAQRSRPAELRPGELVVDVVDSATGEVVSWARGAITESMVAHGHDGGPLRIRTRVVRRALR